MKIVIVGCGRVGARLALRFHELGYEVSVVDKDRSAFQRLGVEFPGATVLGLGFDEDVLKTAGIKDADIFLTITGGDNSNLMAAQIAKLKYGITNVISRVKDPLRAEIYRDLGIHTFCNTVVSARILEDLLLHKPLRPVESYLRLQDTEPGSYAPPGERPLSVDDAGMILERIASVEGVPGATAPPVDSPARDAGPLTEPKTEGAGHNRGTPDSNAAPQSNEAVVSGGAPAEPAPDGPDPDRRADNLPNPNHST